MIERIASLKPWQILALGLVAVLAAMLAVTFVAHLCYIVFPSAWGVVAVGQLVVGGLAGWFTAGWFVDAYMLNSLASAWSAIEVLFPSLDAFDDANDVFEDDEDEQ